MTGFIKSHPRLQAAFGLLVCFTLGSLCALSMAPTNYWPLLFLGLSVIYILLAQSQGALGAFAKGWAFGFGYFVFGLSWIGNALLVDGNPYSWVWPLAVAALPMALALFTAFATLLAYKASRLRTASGYLTFVATLALSEWCRGHFFTGFPWNLFAYTWADIQPVIQTVFPGDTYFLTLLTIFWAALPGYLYLSQEKLQKKLTVSALVLLSFALSYGYGAWRINTYAPSNLDGVSIRLVQPNISQAEKWNPAKQDENFSTLIDLSMPGTQENKTTFIIWPETTISYRHLENEFYLQKIIDLLNSYKGQAYVLAGALLHDREKDEYTNSLVMIDANGAVSNIYDKHHLVPFGEYIPFQRWIPLDPFVQFKGFKKGQGLMTQKTPESLTYSPLVCYEIIFPGRTISANGERPDFIVNATNDAWYGDSAGPRQHFTQAVFRAVETGIPVIRVANTGISGVIDPYGHILDKSALFQKYAKNLALPSKNMPSFTRAWPKNILFVALNILLIVFGFQQTRGGKLKA